MIRLSAFADEISADPVEQIDVLEPSTASATSSSARSTAPTSSTCTDAQHEEFRALLQQRGFGLERDRLADRQDQDHRPVRAAPRAIRAGARPGRVLRDARASGSSAIYMPPGDDPATPSATRSCGGCGELAELRRRARASRSSSRTRRGSTATPPPACSTSSRRSTPQPLARLRPGELPRGRPADRRGLDACSARGSPTSTSRTTTPTTHKNVPAGQGDGQIPELIADAVAHGYDGFCVLEPHLVVAEQIVRLHRPRAVRRRRPRPSSPRSTSRGSPTPESDRLPPPTLDPVRESSS